MVRLNDQEPPVALVTGATQGIGQAIATSLVDEGWRVGLVARSENDLENMASRLSHAAHSTAVAVAVAADFSSAPAIEAAIERTYSEFGRLDCLVNNAGSAPFGSLTDVPDQAWVDAIDLKLLGYVRASRFALPYLEHTKGSIINIVGSGGSQTLDSHMLAGAINAALIHFTRSLAREVGNSGVRVNAISPGPIDTQRIGKLVEKMAESQGTSVASTRTQFTAEIPLGRFGRPEEVAALVAFLISESAGFISGENILIDGAMTAGV